MALPEPVISQASFKLYQGDCVAILRSLPHSTVDLIFADPPYNLSNGGFTCHAGRAVPVHKGDWDQSAGQDADVKFITQWLSACQQVLKPSGTIWVSGTQHVIFNVGYVMQSLGFHILNTVTWFKPNASPNLSCRYFTHSSEFLIWAAPHKGKKLQHTFNYEEMRQANGGRQMRDVWELSANDKTSLIPRIFEESPPSKEEKFYGKHPTQKPVALLDRIVRSSSNLGDVVLDPFNGAGSTGVVAVALKRRYIGIELDEHYLAITKKRLTELQRQIDLPLAE